MPRKFELIAVQGHPRSMALVPFESAYATSYQSLIVISVLSSKLQCALILF